MKRQCVCVVCLLFLGFTGESRAEELVYQVDIPELLGEHGDCDPPVLRVVGTITADTSSNQITNSSLILLHDGEAYPFPALPSEGTQSPAILATPKELLAMAAPGWQAVGWSFNLDSHESRSGYPEDGSFFIQPDIVGMAFNRQDCEDLTCHHRAVDCFFDPGQSLPIVVGVAVPEASSGGIAMVGLSILAIHTSKRRRVVRV